MSLLNEIRDTCELVVNTNDKVSIDADAITAWAEKFSTENAEEIRRGVDWDADGWHYCQDVAQNGPLTCQYVFVLDSLNFCFWPTAGLEYDTLATRLKIVLENDPHAFDAASLAEMSEETLRSWFPGNELPQLTERVKRLRELGTGLLETFNGLGSNVVSCANKSASRLVKIVTDNFIGFRDTSVYRGTLVHFYKRAQILIGDIWAAYGRPTDPSHPFFFHDLDQLTMFADYRIPQILRSFGILLYSPSLEQSVDNCIEIPFGSEEEIAIRAATVIAVERLHKELLRHGAPFLVIELDWLLWQQGEAAKDDIRPHHRTRTIYY